MRRIRACFDLARAGNFPSVASNVLAALVLSQSPVVATGNYLVLALAIAAGCLMYAGGATFNDVFDAKFDAHHRPERVIPRGIISRGDAAWLATTEMALGCAVFLGLRAFPLRVAALVITILAYDWLHKKWIGSVILMAGCRVLLALTVARSFEPAFLWWIGALFVYIVTLSLIARWEYQPGAPAAKIGRSVGRLLAFIPLIDAIALLLVGEWRPAIACAVAVPLGRMAQRLAAAT